MDDRVNRAIDYLKQNFGNLHWKSAPDLNQGSLQVLKWPAEEHETIAVTAFNGYESVKNIHRHDYFYFWFMYDCNNQHVHFSDNSSIRLKQNDFFVGQPYSVHSLWKENHDTATIISILVKKEAVYRYFVPAISFSSEMLDFFLRPSLDMQSAEYMCFNIPDDYHIRRLCETMVVEYAEKQNNYQENLIHLAQVFISEATRQYLRQLPQKKSRSLYNRIAGYINSHISTVNLTELAKRFSYHPNYICRLIKKESGVTFSRLLLQRRMERAVILLKSGDLAIEQISSMLGYSNPSNFHKAFKKYYGITPREYAGAGN